jgi:hypothetical protein
MWVFGENEKIEMFLIVRVPFCVCTAHFIKGEATVIFSRNRREEYALRSVAVPFNYVISTNDDAITKAQLAQTSCVVDQRGYAQDASSQMVIHRRTCMWPISSG